MKVWLVYGAYMEHGVVAVCSTESRANQEAARIVNESDPTGPPASPDDPDMWGGLAFVRSAEVLEGEA